MYKSLLRPLLFSFESETIHDLSMKALSLCSQSRLVNLLHAFLPAIDDPRLEVNVGQLSLPNPVGLAAGFDKQAVAFDCFALLGFGAVEVGTITSDPQQGNPRPRIFRLLDDHALINRMGFPSEGILGVEERLRDIAQRKKSSGTRAALGINIGKSKAIPLEKAAENYRDLLTLVAPYADYVTVNISSPNTPCFAPSRTSVSHQMKALCILSEQKGPAEPLQFRI